MSVKQNNIFHSTVIDDKISVALFSIDGNTAHAGIDDRTFLVHLLQISKCI
ncbi:MAG: hypothetical protein J5606_02895 [Bacteroidales bacterium]|nr:hypothetical protein [Bacteroidales bacterium]